MPLRMREPLSGAAAGPRDEHRSAGRHAAGGAEAPHSILVVDDHPSNRELMSRALGVDGYRPVTAASGEEALELARVERPSLVITDILMSGMNGFELARRLRGDRELADVRILLWTAHYDDREVGELAAALDVNGVLAKPCAPTVVLDAVSGLLAPEPSSTQRGESAAEFDREQVRVLSDKLEEKAAELERARGALRESEDRFRLLVANIPGAVYRRSPGPDMTIEFVSETIEDLERLLGVYRDVPEQACVPARARAAGVRPDA
jgi:CheY-like chemotaxis protein